MVDYITLVDREDPSEDRPFKQQGRKSNGAEFSEIRSAINALLSTRLYDFATMQRLAVDDTSTLSEILGEEDGEIMVHAKVPCYIVLGTNPEAHVETGMPIDAGEKFHLQYRGGDRLAVIRHDTNSVIYIFRCVANSIIPE